MMPKAVFFDLDDTIFDHQHSRRLGLRAIRERYPALKAVSVEALELEHERLLISSYAKTLDRAISLDDAIVERIRLLCAGHGVLLGPEEANSLTGIYREAYERSRRAVPGVKTLLRRLKEKDVRTGVISNGLTDIQNEKIAICGVGDWLDAVVISEDAGSRKPDPGIFSCALRMAGASPEDAVFIGDSWDTDVIGARHSGIRAVWLNRYGGSSSDITVPEIRSFEHLENIIRIVFFS